MGTAFVGCLLTDVDRCWLCLYAETFNAVMDWSQNCSWTTEGTRTVQVSKNTHRLATELVAGWCSREIRFDLRFTGAVRVSER